MSSGQDLGNLSRLAVHGLQQPHVRILWVDDTPSNNAMEIAQIAKWDIDVTQSLSTDEAIGILKSQTGFDAVVSDMGRTEGGAYRAQAGLILLNTMRTAGITAPFMIYSSSRLAQRNREDVLNAGGDGATSSTVELLEWIRKKTGVTAPAS
jgi:CheY-like chemotaxis protein